ncbi:MAG: GGDEF domain-containing protein [Thermodesulfovibrionia bacterium]|nr:GGDEF domain-containing protein [Thermodesulfovibrionia bacterium]
MKELEHTSQTDGLTGLLNRQHLNKRLSEEISRAKRYGNPLSLIMFDIDNFKKINDKYGHIAGDKILQKIASVLKETLRNTDIAGRFGGDEFIVILVQTDINVGMQVAERIHSRVEQARITPKKEQSINFIISMGICQYNKGIKSLEDFIAKVDEGLYRAKHTGYNKICKAKD